MDMVDVGWKKVALPVMEHYTEETDGSFMELEESALLIIVDFMICKFYVQVIQ